MLLDDAFRQLQAYTNMHTARQLTKTSPPILQEK